MPLSYQIAGKVVEKFETALPPLRAGTSDRVTITVKNDFKSDIMQLSLKPLKNAKIISYPQSLKRGESGELVIEYSAKADREEPFSDVLDWELVLA